MGKRTGDGESDLPQKHVRFDGVREAAKERVTTAYTRVPSKSKLLANELPNRETTLQIKRHSDDIKTYVFRNSDVRNFTPTQNAVDTEKLASEQVTAKAICLKNTQDSMVSGTPHRSEAALFAKRRLWLQQISLMARLTF